MVYPFSSSLCRMRPDRARPSCRWTERRRRRQPRRMRRAPAASHSAAVRLSTSPLDDLAANARGWCIRQLQTSVITRSSGNLRRLMARMALVHDSVWSRKAPDGLLVLGFGQSEEDDAADPEILHCRGILRLPRRRRAGTALASKMIGFLTPSPGHDREGRMKSMAPCCVLCERRRRIDSLRSAVRRGRGVRKRYLKRILPSPSICRKNHTRRKGLP